MPRREGSRLQPCRLRRPLVLLLSGFGLAFVLVETAGKTDQDTLRRCFFAAADALLVGCAKADPRRIDGLAKPKPSPA